MRLLTALVLLTVICCIAPAMAQFQSGAAIAPGTPTSYTGLVATRGGMPNDFNGTNKQFQTRTAHWARGGITSLQLALPNFWGNTTSGEVGSGGTATVTASVEYPAGVCNQVKFGGATSFVIANGAYVVSDSLPITIPNNAEFFVRYHYTSAVGIVYNFSNATSMIPADGFAFGVTTPDLTVTCTGVAATTALGDFPLAIIGQTTRPSVCLIGDSRVTGVQDTTGPTGDIGEFARSVGPVYSYTNLGNPGDTLTDAISGTPFANRLALSTAYCTVTLINFGINDVTAGTSAATMVTNMNTLIALFPVAQKIFVSTLVPDTTTSDNWATPTRIAPGGTNNQTANVHDSVRVTYNGDLRANGSITGIWGIIDLANVVESAWNSGVWVGPSMTPDGIHESGNAALQEQWSGAVPIGSFTR